MIPFSATIDEFEQGSWVADIVTFDQFSGTFQLQSDGDTWTGTKVSERFDDGKFYTRVIGGQNHLATVIDDKYYNGSVSLTAALQDICNDGGESIGSAKAAIFLTPFMRIRGKVSEALQTLAEAFSLMWWIDRDGTLSVNDARQGSGSATGYRVKSDTDSCVTLDESTGVKLGATYSSDENDTMTIRHVRWRLTKAQLLADIYAVPFLFRPPTDNRYSGLRDARVDRDNGDGTIDVIASGRFGVTKVQLLCGVPGSKVEVRGGEIVSLGFFGSDPQKPFAIAMGQDVTAVKRVARVGDTIDLGVGAVLTGNATGVVPGAIVFTLSAPAPSVGTVSSGSARIKIGD